MKNKILLLILIFIIEGFKSQVLITDSENTEPVIVESSAILEIRSDKRGILLPEVPLISNTDNVTVSNPVNGVNVHSITDKRFMFWLDDRWYRNFNIQDVDNRLKVTSGYVAEQTSKTDVTSFPNSMPMFTIGSNTTGWTDLGVSTVVSITKAENSISVNVEGMASINNVSRVPFQFAIGVFIDEQLVLVRKFFEPRGGSCSWKQFNLSGIIENRPVLAQEGHVVKVMAYNLPNSSDSFNMITYGDKSRQQCANLNTDMAKTVLSVSVTQ